MSFRKISAAVLLLAACGSSFAGERIRASLNRDWKFTLGDPHGAEAVAFADSAWEPVALPHSFSLPYFRSAQFYIGYGWYRKHFEVRSEWRSRRIFLEFDGAFQDAEIFVNGQRAGTHRGGYTGFSLDITAAAHPGENVVAVRLNNNWNAQLAPRAGEHEFCGGIYRDAWLVVADPVHIAWNGVFVTTPQVSVESARVNIKTEVRNSADAAARCTLVTTILDPDNHAIAEIRAQRTVPAQTTFTFDQTSDAIPHPKLWHPDHPYLYSVRTALLKDGKAHVQAGGGWVNDSTPEGEYQETVNKAKAMLKAVALAEGFARQK
jgi:beta-galactosidase